MSHYNISDEELAAYLDGMLSEQDAAKIDGSMDVDTLEIMNVSRRAMGGFRQGKTVKLPSWENFPAETAASGSSYEPLAMAGFLGESNTVGMSDSGQEENDRQ